MEYLSIETFPIAGFLPDGQRKYRSAVPELESVRDAFSKRIHSYCDRLIDYSLHNGSLLVRGTSKVPHPDTIFVKSSEIDKVYCTRRGPDDVYADIILQIRAGISERDTGRSDTVFLVYRIAGIWNIASNCYCAMDIRPYNSLDRKEGQELSEYLVPYIHKEDLEGEAQRIIEVYYPESSMRQQCVRATELAERMGLHIRYAKLSQNGMTMGMLFLMGGRVKVIDEHGRGNEIDVPENTIIIDREACHEKPQCIESTILHECVHAYEHRYYFLFQKSYHLERSYMAKAVKGLMVYRDESHRKAVNIVEWQANEIGARIRMPEMRVRMIADSVLGRLGDEDIDCDDREEKKEVAEELVDAVAKEFDTSRESAKIRLLSLGYNFVRGAYNYVDGHYVPFFKTSDNWLSTSQTFVISCQDAIREFEDNPEFRRLVQDGGYAFVENHFCIQDSKYLHWLKTRIALTPYARRHIEECCIPFDTSSCRVDQFYSDSAFHRDRSSPYVDYGRMTCSQVCESRAAYYATEDELHKYLTFADTLDYHIEKNGYTNESLAEEIGCSVRTVSRYRSGKAKIFKLKYILAFCFALHLEPKFSYDLLGKAGIALRNYEPEKTYQFLLQCCYMKSVKECSEILVGLGYEPLVDDNIDKC